MFLLKCRQKSDSTTLAMKTGFNASEHEPPDLYALKRQLAFLYQVMLVLRHLLGMGDTRFGQISNGKR